jgi:probable F420-dependent oxidoreductase
MAADAIAKAFRFAIGSADGCDPAHWLAAARRAEQLGYDVFKCTDHYVNRPDPMIGLMAAASVTSAIRLATGMANNEARHPAQTAREIATIDGFSAGRVELGLGAGWARAEFDRLGVPFPAAGERIERLEESVHIIRQLFAGGPVTFSGRHYRVTGLEGYPRPVQQPGPPIMIGGSGRKLLSAAGRIADTVSIAPVRRPDGSGSSTADYSRASVTDQVGWVTAAAGPRAGRIEFGIMLVACRIGPDRRACARDIADQVRAGAGGRIQAADRGQDLAEAAVLESPCFLVGTVAQIVDDLLERREQLGISYYSLLPGGLETFAPVLQEVAGR